MEAFISHSLSHPSSPQSSALPSPPSSPGSSFSSLPSSAFSFSVPSSPPRHDSPLPHAAHSLILPSLLLDTTEECAHNLSGEALGNVKLLILGSKGSGKTFLAESLVHGNPDVVDVGDWVEEPSLGKVLNAGTRVEGETSAGTENVTLVEVAGFDQTDDPHSIVAPVLDAIHSRFRAILPLLSQTYPANPALRELIASSQSQLFTAVLLLTSSPPTSFETTLLSLLSSHIPVISIPSPSLPHTSRSSSRARSRAPRPATSSLRPLTPHHLRTTLFRRPSALRTLRYEAAERFLWWREIEAAKQQPDTLDVLLGGRGGEDPPEHEENRGKWEWESHLSRDIAIAREAVQKLKDTATAPSASSPCLPLDPLHMPSLFFLSLSLLRPLRESVLASFGTGFGVRWWAVTVVGAFCAGVGVGWLLSGA